MNPNENNPISQAGAGGVATGATPYAGATSGASGSESAGTPAASSASSVSAPVDFTNLGNEGGLSMSDSLASAQDNLTSAGQAANIGTHTPALDQLGADNPAAEMASPNQPLTPAAPLPGSLGSVSSGTPATNATTSNMPVMGGGASSSAANATSAAGATTDTAAQPYFNPFASATAPTSATTASVPPALQPQAKSFKSTAQTSKGRGGVMNLLAWILVVVLAGTTVLFAILWQMAENKAPQEKIVYVDRPVDANGMKGAISCTMNLGGDGVEGLENLISRNRTMKADYEGGELKSISLTTGYDFVDGDSAEAARGYFGNEDSYYANIAMGLAIEPVATNLQIDGGRADYTVTASVDQLVGECVNIYGISLDAEGNPDTSMAGIQQDYESAGYVCAVAE